MMGRNRNRVVPFDGKTLNFVSLEFESFCSSELENNTSVCHRKVCGEKIFWGKDDVLAISFCRV